MSSKQQKTEHTIKITTFNTGLLDGDVLYAVERLPNIIQALNDQNFESDIVCLQEVWSEKDRDEIIAKTKNKFPYVHFLPAKQEYLSDKPSCSYTQKEFADAADSMRKNCSTEPVETLGLCYQSKCTAQLGPLVMSNPLCATALMTQTGNVQSLEELLKVLTEHPGNRYMLNGSNGLLVLSQHPIKDQDHLFLTSFLTHRAALYVSIVKDGIEYHVCTAHTTSDFSPLPYLGACKSWGDEIDTQYKEILAWLEQKKIAGTVYIAADLNCSFADKERGIGGWFAQSCELFPSAGFVDLVRGRIACTFCVDENHILLDKIKMGIQYPEGKDLIDHIFAMNLPDDVRINVEVMFNEPISITMNNKKMVTHLSDHYGIRATITTYE